MTCCLAPLPIRCCIYHRSLSRLLNNDKSPAMNMRLLLVISSLFITVPAYAASNIEIAGIPVDFILFAETLLCVALFHHYTLQVALTGLLVISFYKIGFTGFHEGVGVIGWLYHMQHEWVVLANLLGLLLGFALLARHFEDSNLPHVLPHFLPADWKGAFVLLAMVFVMSAFLDNIAAALIGGTVAASVFRRRVHIGYLAAIVAASNAGAVQAAWWALAPPR